MFIKYATCIQYCNYLQNVELKLNFTQIYKKKYISYRNGIYALRNIVFNQNYFKCKKLYMYQLCKNWAIMTISCLK